MTCAQGLLRLLWGGARSWSAMGLICCRYFYKSFVANICKIVMKDVHKQIEDHYSDAMHINELLTLTALDT